MIPADPAILLVQATASGAQRARDKLTIMAKRAVEVCECDRCGKEPAHSWTITGPDGAPREIELCDQHASPIANAYALGRPVAKKPPRPARSRAARPKAATPDAKSAEPGTKSAEPEAKRQAPQPTSAAAESNPAATTPPAPAQAPKRTLPPVPPAFPNMEPEPIWR
jgi:hypothetical protein